MAELRSGSERSDTCDPSFLKAAKHSTIPQRASHVQSSVSELCEHGAMGRKKRRPSEHHDILEAPRGGGNA